ncbi:MAG: dihydroorotate dehydrogenase electron transfer subunit [Lachnospiraceae bacterium]|nr:dihydroorotate dehydrogenase electron transfer subunit [Lachnospiraceae bacterium]
MIEKFRETSFIIRQEEIAKDVYSLWLKTGQMTDYTVPGQFINIYSRDGSRLLPRPVSICEVDHRERALRVVYRVVGKGTKEFSGYHTGRKLEILGPLGNGFPLKEKKAFLIGGGVGIPPMLYLAKELQCEKQILLGYRDETFLTEELKKYGQVYVATEDGSSGVHGNVLDIIRTKQLEAEIIYACGPLPMLKAVKEYAKEQGIEAWISMEERMACGIGACLGCICKSKDTDEHTNVKNKRVCKEGPVFLAEEVELS